MSAISLPFPDVDLADMFEEHKHITERLVNIAKFTAQLSLIEIHLDTIKTQLEYERTDKYKLKCGVKKVKCKKCNNSFIGGIDYHKHLEDGRCETSRTCKTCNSVFLNSMAKSRHKKDCK